MSAEGSFKNSEVIRNTVFELHRFIIKTIQAVLILKLLSLADFGSYSLVNIWSLAVLPVFSLGFGLGLQYNVARKEYELEEILFSVLVVATCISIICHVVMLFILKANVLAIEGLNEFSLLRFAIVAIYASLRLKNSFLDLALKGKGEFSTFRLSSLVRIYVGLTLLGSLYFLALLNVSNLFVVLLVADLSKTVYILSRVGVVRLRLNNLFVNDSYRYGIKAWFGSLSQVANNKIDQIFASAFLSLEALGAYAFALNMMQFINFIPSAVSPVLLRHTIKTSKLEGIKVLFRVHRITFYVSGIGFVLYLLIFTPIVSVWFPEIPKVTFITVTLLVGPGVVFYSTTRRLLSKYISGKGRPELSSYIQLFGSIITLVMLIIFSGTGGGIWKFALANSLGFFTSVIVSIIFFRRLGIKAIFPLYNPILLKSDILLLLKRK